MNLLPLTDLRDPDTPAPTAVDESGRSSQVFLMDVIVTKDDKKRRATASGRDIYAITAPIVVEATERILKGEFKTSGAVVAGEIFDAEDFLFALSDSGLSFKTHDELSNTAGGT